MSPSDSITLVNNHETHQVLSILTRTPTLIPYQMANNELTHLLPSSSTASAGENRRSSSNGGFGRLLISAAGQSAAAILIVIGVAITFRTSQRLEHESTLSFFGKSRQDKSYDCEKDSEYSKLTLKRAYELPFAALFKDHRGQNKYEASDVTIVGDEVYSVCDNSWAISRFSKSLVPFNEENVQVGDPNRVPGEDSGYEAIFHHNGLFYVVRESVYHGNHEEGKLNEVGDYHAIIEELKLSENDYEIVNQCQCEFEFEGDSKGFEGAVAFPDENDNLYILGLCEGNYCSEKRKFEIGNGRIVLMKKGEDQNMAQCLWETVRVVNIPESAAFLDYSAIDITKDGRVAITSQEHSAIWLGRANGIQNGVINPETFDFEINSGKVLNFPKNGECETVYCNIEGIHFLNDAMLIAVSDKMKGKGRQDFRCHEKDQSIHAFVIP